MKIYFLRHGIAADREDRQGSDEERPLTKEGRRSMKREAKAIEKLDLGIEALITSPLVRAKETAEFIADHLDLKCLEDGRLRPGFDVDALKNIVADHFNRKAVMLVGHEPDFSETISQVIGGGEIDLKKGGLACVDVENPAALEGTLVLLAPPKLL